jgi:hypothetical protein
MGCAQLSAVRDSDTTASRIPLHLDILFLTTFPFSITTRFNVALVLCAVALTLAPAMLPLHGARGANMVREVRATRIKMQLKAAVATTVGFTAHSSTCTR